MHGNVRPAPVLVVLGGLPGVGKSTIARALLARWQAVYLRIDTIEQALRDAGVLHGGEVGPAGYGVAGALAQTQLALGLPVLVDCVNPLAVSRGAWHGVAHRAHVPCLDVEVVCTDSAEHRRRVEQRVSDVPGLVPPTWAAVCQHGYEAWPASAGVLAVDSAHCSADAAAALIRSRALALAAACAIGSVGSVDAEPACIDSHRPSERPRLP